MIFPPIQLPINHKTCIKHTFLNKNVIPPKNILPTYLPRSFPDRYRKQTLFYSRPKPDYNLESDICGEKYNSEFFVMYISVIMNS